jgi:hypothetical protein
MPVPLHRFLRRAPRCLALVGLTLATAVPAAHAARLATIVSGLNQPKKLTVTADGDLIVALSGDGVAPKGCTDGEQRPCLDNSGTVDLVTPSGHVRRLRSGLPSIAESHSDSQATGPVQAELRDGILHVLFQNTSINATTGDQIYGTGGTLLDTLTAFDGSGTGSSALQADLGPFEARENPDHGEGTNVSDGEDVAKDSDPYGFVAYRGGYAVVDAGANDVLWVSASGTIRVLAVLPTIRERAAAGTFGSAQKRAIEAAAQPVPDAIAVGPDGALYIGDFGGEPYDADTSVIYRILPGHAAAVVARGFTAIDDITFDASGRMLVLELDRKGLNDPGLEKNHPAAGALYRLSDTGKNRQLLRSRGLTMPTGVAVHDGEIYVTIDGLSTHGGRIVRFREDS